MGFEASLFTATVDENLLCSLCYGVFDKPSLACLNGHVFCAECLAQTKRRRDACPDCRDPIFDPAPLVRPTQNMIVGLTLCCENSQPRKSEGGGDAAAAAEAEEPPATRRRTTRSGAAVEGEERKKKEDVCDWTGTVAEYRDHAESCGFKIVKCPNNCMAEIVRRFLEHHKENECLFRTVTCVACSHSVSHKLLKAHQELHCPEGLTKCAYCEAKMKRRKDLGRKPWRWPIREDHVEKETNRFTGHYKTCPKLLLNCEFYDLGCDTRIPRNEMAAHHVDKARYHAQLLSDRIRYNNDWKKMNIEWEISKHRIQGNGSSVIVSPNVPIFGNNFQVTLHLDGQKVEMELSAEPTIPSRRSDITVRKIDIHVEVTKGGEMWDTAHPFELENGEKSVHLSRFHDNFSFSRNDRSRFALQFEEDPDSEDEIAHDGETSNAQQNEVTRQMLLDSFGEDDDITVYISFEVEQPTRITLSSS